ncbi:MAG: sigma-70 family RNA polymerase sigma factor [Bryobacteraceae bacterium]|nr:sigma-70 family RNA polymerase sigma factor [Bryobacteraceae bacterium]
MADEQVGDVTAKAASGDRDAFAALIRRNQAMVYSLAWHSLGDEGLAEELSQDVFLELHRALPGLESEAHVTNWLRRVTMHRCIDQARRRKSRPQVALDDVSEPAAESAGNPDFYLRSRLQTLIGSMPERARSVLLLRYQEDMEPTEIAGVLGLPVNTVKSQLHRSLAMLRDKLQRTRVTA